MPRPGPTTTFCSRIVLGLALLACAGCVEKYQNHSGYTVCKQTPWVGLGMLAGLGVFACIAWRFKKSIAHFVFMAALLAFMGLFLVNNHQLIRFKDVKEIQVIPRSGFGADADRTFVDWNFHMKSGEVRTIHGSSLLDAATNEIVQAATRQPIVVKLREPGGWTVFQRGGDGVAPKP
jgi:hypothetical protein